MAVYWILFAVSLTFFHYWLYSDRIPKHYWVAVDYVWVGLATVTLLSKTVEIRRNQLQSDVEVQSKELENGFMRALEQTTYLEQVVTPTNPQAGQFFGHLKGSLLQQHDDILSHFDTTAWQRIIKINQKTPFNDTFIADMKIPLDMELGLLNAKLERIQVDKTRARETPFEKMLFQFTPFLLAVAIALRLTKVSFDMKNVRKTTIDDHR